MKNKFFSVDNWVWSPFGKVADFLILSCLWLLCSIPIVTLGGATTAMFDCCARCVNGKEREMFARFFRTLRREIVPSAISLVLWAAVLGGGYWAIKSVAALVEVNSVSVVMSAGALVLWVWGLGVSAWVLPLLSRFTFTVGALNSTALRLALSHPIRTLLLAAVNLLIFFVCIRFIFPVMVAPAVASSLSALILEPVFNRYEETVQDT